MMRIVSTMVLAACFVLPVGQAGAQSSQSPGAAVQSGQYGSYWYRYDTAEFYGGSWHPGGSFQNPSYQHVANDRRAWLEGGHNRWASAIYTVYVP